VLRLGCLTLQPKRGLSWDILDRDSVSSAGSCSLRVLNRKAGFDFPLEGPKTINGLLLESLEDIPEAGTTLSVDDHPVEILQVQNRMVKVVRILPHARTPEESKEAA